MTLEDVARAAGVHYSTVSRALDPATARQVNVVTGKRVQAVAKRLGYRKDMVASGLKRGRTHTVAVVVGDLGNPNTAPLLRAISNRLEPAGLMPLIVETQKDPARLERILNHLLSRRVDAIIVTAARLGDAPTLRRIRRRGIPIVLAVQTVPGIRLAAFTNDDILGGSLAARHLLALGHRRVAQLRGPADIYSCLQRAQGFSRTIAAAGATEVVLPSTGPRGTAEEGRRLMNLLLDRKGPLPTGIFAHHDRMAFGALSAAEERGLVCPGDFSIVGYNDLPHLDRTWCRHSPRSAYRARNLAVSPPRSWSIRSLRGTRHGHRASWLQPWSSASRRDHRAHRRKRALGKRQRSAARSTLPPLHPYLRPQTFAAGEIG